MKKWISVLTVLSLSGCISDDMEKTIFVSSKTYNGNLGGISQADVQCQLMAMSAGLEGKYIVLLSDSTTDAISRFDFYDPNIAINNTAGENIANGLEDLFDSVINYSISYNEFGESLGEGGASNITWTGTSPDGTRLQHTCSDWTSNDPSEYAFVGFAHLQNAAWLQNQVQYCDASNVEKHIYCLEQ